MAQIPTYIDLNGGMRVVQIGVRRLSQIGLVAEANHHNQN
jgi:hypothetical protein